MPAETRTHSLAYVIEQTGVPSSDWLRRKLNAGEISGIKAGREWRMTDSDIAALIDYMRRPARQIAAAPASASDAGVQTGRNVSGLTARSRRKLQRTP